jgi:uncharacterized repeat protein (TIGR01451 family)
MKIKLCALVAVVAALAAYMTLPALAVEQPSTLFTHKVQNQTTNSETVDANSADQALTAKNGDVLKYTVTLSNTAKATIEDDAELINGVITNSLPAGIELVSDPQKRTISENLPAIKAGRSVTKQYLAKVTGKEGDVITSKACFTAKYTNKSDNQAACDDAVIKVAASTAAPAPTSPVVPTPTTPAPQTPTPTPVTPAPAADDGKLPTAGPGDTAATIAFIGIVVAFAYSLRMFLYTRKTVA